jgi:hypothetical protein
MTTATSPPGNRVLRRRILVSASVIAIGVLGAAIVLSLNWPFTQAAVTKALQDRFARDVKIHNFRKTFFPPGCVAQGVEFLHRRRKDLPPLITVQQLTIRASYSGLLRIHQTVNDIHVDGLHVLIPPKAQDGIKQVFPLTNSTSGKNVDIGEIATDNAVLEFMPKEPGQEHFVLRIDHLSLDDVSQSDPVTFHVRFKNTQPPGEIISDGQLGPWNEDDPGSTQVSGSYVYQHVNLGVFDGIAGTLSSRGRYSGPLGHIEAEGDVDVPDFEVSHSGHPVHLASTFHASIDGTNGDTDLTRVESHFRKTTLVTQGDVKGHPGGHGKTARLTFSVDQGRVEDLLWMFSQSPRPAENGNVQLHAKVELPPGPPSFLRRLQRCRPDAGQPACRKCSWGEKGSGGPGPSSRTVELEGSLCGARRRRAPLQYVLHRTRNACGDRRHVQSARHRREAERSPSHQRKTGGYHRGLQVFRVESAESLHQKEKYHAGAFRNQWHLQ